MTTPTPDKVSFAEHAVEIIAKAADLVASEVPFALITSLAIEGGAARDVGSLAIVEADGSMTGYLSNGCIDRDIQHHAMEALKLGQKKLIRYGDGSRFADLKLPCGGALTVLIDPKPDIAALSAAHKTFAARKPVTLSFKGPPEAGTQFSKSFTYTPRYRLVLAGRGAIFRAMARIGHSTGYDIHLLSPDMPDLEAVGHLSSATPIHLSSPLAEHKLDMLDNFSAFLTLFHDHDWEPYLLRAALDTEAAFIGSLGSRRTHELRQETLRQLGVPEVSLARLKGPIGMVASLRDASSISVSALAEIVAAFQANNAPLRDSEN